jgi:hypothetical protein
MYIYIYTCMHACMSLLQQGSAMLLSECSYFILVLLPHLCMRICIRMYVHTHMYACMYTHTYVCICMYTHTYVCICMYTHTYVCICMYTHICMYMYMYLYMCISPFNVVISFVFLTSIHTYIHIYIYTHIPGLNQAYADSE